MILKNDFEEFIQKMKHLEIRYINLQMKIEKFTEIIQMVKIFLNDMQQYVLNMKNRILLIKILKRCLNMIFKNVSDLEIEFEL